MVGWNRRFRGVGAEKPPIRIFLSSYQKKRREKGNLLDQQPLVHDLYRGPSLLPLTLQQLPRGRENAKSGSQELGIIAIGIGGIALDYISHLRSMVGHENVIMVVAGAIVFNEEGDILLQLRTDSESWGLPGGFMELDESVEDTARREVKEETGLRLGKLELFGVYSGIHKHQTFANGDQVAVVETSFTCHDYEGKLIKKNEESLSNRFFALNDLPEELFTEHQQVIDDVLSRYESG